MIRKKDMLFLQAKNFPPNTYEKITLTYDCLIFCKQSFSKRAPAKDLRRQYGAATGPYHTGVGLGG